MSPTEHAFYRFEKRHRDRLHKRLALPGEAAMTKVQAWGVGVVVAVLAVACLVLR